MNGIAKLLIIILLAVACSSVRAALSADSLIRETFAFKTNLLYDAGGVPSLGVEFPVTRDGRWSLDLSGTYNPMRMTGSEFWKNWLIQPEIRYNFGHSMGRPRGITFFWGTHLLGGQYNLQRTPWLKNIWRDLNDWRFQGWGIGAGTGIGVRFNISARFGIELEAAAGYIYTRYNRYRCGNCGERAGRGSRHYVGPSKAAVNFLIRLYAPAKKKAEVRDEWPVRVDTLTVESVVTDTIVLRDTVAPDTLVIAPELRHDRMALRIDFKLDGSEIDPAMGRNRACLDSLSEFIERYRDDMTIRVRGIRAEGFSSIDGGAAYNLSLSGRRAAALGRYISAKYPELAPLVETVGSGEDWESLDFPGKDELMRIADLDLRQRRLMELDGGRIYRRLADEILPGTRRVEVTIDYTMIENTIFNH